MENCNLGVKHWLWCHRHKKLDICLFPAGPQMLVGWAFSVLGWLHEQSWIRAWFGVQVQSPSPGWVGTRCFGVRLWSPSQPQQRNFLVQTLASFRQRMDPLRDAITVQEENRFSVPSNPRLDCEFRSKSLAEGRPLPPRFFRNHAVFRQF